MTWIHTQQKPEKRCDENPLFPAASIFQDVNWELSGASKSACLIAASMILAYNIRTVVEIGIYYGFTSQILSKALTTNAMEDGLLISCDINPRACQRSREIVKDLPIKHIIVEGDSTAGNWKEHLGDRKIGLGFVDGDHTYEAAMADMKNCSQVLDRNGIMIVHDYSPRQRHGVFNAVNEFAARTNMPWFYLPEDRIAVDYRTAIFQNREVY
jgi:predicted O-methyltransferase YrrM